MPLHMDCVLCPDSCGSALVCTVSLHLRLDEKTTAQLFASHLGKVKPATRFIGSKQRVSFELSHKSEAGGVNHPLSIEGLKGSPRLQPRLNAYVIGDSS